MGYGVQTDLAPQSGGGVPADLGDERVRRFMAGGRKKKNYVGDESHHQHLGGKIVHRVISVGPDEQVEKLLAAGFGVTPSYDWKTSALSNTPD